MVMPFYGVMVALLDEEVKVRILRKGLILLYILWSGVMVACQAHNLETRYRVRIPPPLEHRDRNFHVVMLGSR